MARLSVLSYHTSPLAQPGTGDAGGMNVYVAQLATALARLGHEVDVYTRRERHDQPDVVAVEPGYRVRHVSAGPERPLQRDELPLYVDDFADALAADFDREGNPDALHANYWLSGLAGHRLKHERDLPLIMTFHTLERVKADQYRAESPERALEEAKLFACADAVLASCEVEAQQFVDYYEADRARVHVVPLGVEHAFFSPGPREAARAALGLERDATWLLFIGRLQALKGVDLALDATIALRQRGRHVHLAIIGGPSGPDGATTLAGLHRRVDEVGMNAAVSFFAPQRHELLSTWLRAADVTLVPSRSESFGLVALESSACGTPVVASAVGGLLTLVEPGVTGQLVGQRDAEVWADAVEEVLAADVDGAMANAAVLASLDYTWRAAATSLVELVVRLGQGRLVRC